MDGITGNGRGAGLSLVDRLDSGGIGEDTFGEQKACRQFGIVSRGAHGDGNVFFDTGRNGAIFQPYFQGFFHRQRVIFFQQGACRYLLYRPVDDRVMHMLKLRKLGG